MTDESYINKSNLDVARHINLALLICGGLSEDNTGFDTVTTINDAGLAKIANIIGKIRDAERKRASKEIEFAGYLARDVEAFLDFLNTSGIAAYTEDQDGLTDRWRRLQSAIYEFRKRSNVPNWPATHK